ncbi:hypothetical protein SAMN05421690_10723 [Nitrosomonas sp. Nm51]|uniref:MFS transporter n=1 Tax=Nitrosomonas sp. Nm51 TaxID=133720 RepID=UPI0008D7FCC6|nr:MFS transporter [Nitrosomonas sp. Nm51]SER77254.1 hypothetical protein SAMN05421690_10723 [Nitrosomonas sp. Nm51]
MPLKKIFITPSIKYALPIALTGATQTLLIITLPVITELTGLKISQISPVFGLAAFAFLAGGYVWPRRVVPGHRRSFLKQLLIAATASQVLFIITLYAGAIELFGTAVMITMLFVTRFSYGLAASGIYPITQAWLINECAESGHARHTVLTHLSATVSVARIFVPLLAAGLAIFRPEIALVLLIGLPLVALLLLPGESSQTSVYNDETPAAPASRWPETTIAIPTVLVHMSLGLTEFIIGPYLASEWQITLGSTLIYTALLLVVIAACMMLAQLASLHFRPRPERILAWSPIGMACGAALAAIYPAALPAGLIFVAVSFALLLPASAAGAVIHHNPQTQTRASAGLYTARILGHLLGVSIAGPLFEIAPNLPLFVAAATALMAIPAGAELREALIRHN